MFGLFRKKPESYFSEAEKQQIVQAIQEAERRTSGEVRIFIENRCRFVDPIHRAQELFFGLKMQETQQRNAVLVYIAMKDRQLAVFGDEGIHQRVGSAFWTAEVKNMLREFNQQRYAAGLVTIIQDIGEALTTHFPYDAKTDKNELPDDIVFGK
ncbi:MAG: TPM domain-containing protein [Chitinophagaceae bacterium]|jgi:uncharacterized membrane protein|nr:TPM domain-containing protein [Chitinophagaceae bacterium]